MIKIKKTLIVFFLNLFFLNLLSAQILSSKELNETKERQVSENEQKFIDTYFKAEKHSLLEEYSEALDAYEKCTHLIPDEPSPYYQMAKLYFYVFHNTDNAEYHIKEAISLSPENEWYHYELLSIYAIQNNLKEQLNTYYNLINLDPENKFYSLEAIKILIELKEYKQAIRFIKKTEKKTGISNELLLALKDIYLAQDNFREAERIGKKLTERSPIFFKNLAEIYMHFNDYEKAIMAYHKLLKVDTDNPNAIVALYKIYSNKNDIKNQELFLLNIAESREINLEIKKDIFYNLVLNNKYKDYSIFKKIIQQAITLHETEPLFNLILGDIYTKEENYPSAIEHYHLSLNSGVIKDDYIYLKLIEIYWKQGDSNAILELAIEAIEKFPFTPTFYYYKALAFFEKGEHQLCIDALLKGKDFIIDNNLLVSDFYAIIGNSYHELNMHTSSDNAYDLAIQYNPENTHVLNNYSYYLSLRSEKLTFAKTMIIKCLELTKKKPNSSFLDTYAWILYKLGEYEQAKVEIEKAIAIQANNPVLLDHYGDILYKLGFLTDAKSEWKKAYELDTENTEIKKKLMINE